MLARYASRSCAVRTSGLLDKYCNELKIMHPLMALKPSLKSRLRNHWHVSNLLQNLANKPLVSVIGILGLCLYVIPGLLILLLGYMARGTETRIITDTEAQAWLTQEEQQAQKLQAEKEARKVANDKKIVELSGSPLRFWYKMSSNQRATLAVVIVGLLIVFACVLNAFMGQTFSPSPQPQSDLAALPKHTVNDYQDNGKGTNLVYVIVADKSLTEEDAKKIITYYENKHPGYIIMNIWIFCDSTYAAVKYVNGVIYSDDPYLSHVMYWLMASKLGTEKRWFHSGPDTDFPAFRSACK